MQEEKTHQILFLKVEKEHLCKDINGVSHIFHNGTINLLRSTIAFDVAELRKKIIRIHHKPRNSVLSFIKTQFHKQYNQKNYLEY